MFFDWQKSTLIGDGKDNELYFTGTAVIERGVVALVTAVRSKINTQVVRTRVQYITQKGEEKIAFVENLTPAEFEKFINEFAMKISTISKGKNKLVEFDHRFKQFSTKDDEFDMENHEMYSVAYTFLVQLATDNSLTDAINAASKALKAIIM